MTTLFLSIFLALELALILSDFSFSIATCHKISNESFVEASCPLNFDVLRKLDNEIIPRPVFIDMAKQCQAVLDALRFIRSEYLRRNGYFLPPPNTSVACWQSYRSLIGEFVHGFDIEASCGYHQEYISKGCMNITTRAQFESLIPVSKLHKIWHYCNQSLESSAVCESCSKKLLSLVECYLDGPGNDSDISECSGYPFMYVAAFVNKFGPTDMATMKCLFSLEYAHAHQPLIISRHKIVIFGVIIGCATGILGASLAVLFLWRRRKKCGREKAKTNFVKDEKNSFVKDETSLVFGFGLYSKSTNLIKFKYTEIKKATMNFSRENIIGKGGFGNVYSGILPDGTEVALKRFKNCSAAGDGTFAHEVEVIASVRHVNLVALRGYCIATVPMEGHQRIIVCDLMHNGSLYDHLFGSGMKKLSWPIRQKIALGTARGLAYLHHGVHPAIIHRDIKASNILLDETFEPKLADFGFARFNSAGMTHFSTGVAGTLGYVAPEYALYGKLTERSDVYSFGVVLLELLSGKNAFENNEGKTSLLTDWAWELVQQGRALDVIEKTMPELGLPEVMEQYVLLAVTCSHPILQARPAMDQIVKILEGNTFLGASSQSS